MAVHQAANTRPIADPEPESGVEARETQARESQALACDPFFGRGSQTVSRNGTHGSAAPDGETPREDDAVPGGMAPPWPAEEPARLDALYRYAVLDTEKEIRFDRITRMAARFFQTPIALISLIDAERQWFKACVGLGVNETHRDISFCGHAILDDAPLVVLDARNDPRFKDNPLVRGEPNIRFYAGAPLVTHDGYRLGTLCLIDQKPRPGFTDADRQTLRDLADMVMDALELRRTVAQRDGAYQKHISVLSSAIDAAQDGVSMTDADGNFVYMNRAHAEMFGYESPEDLVGTPWHRLYDEAERTRIATTALTAVFERGFWTGEADGRDRNGRVVPQEIWLTRSEGNGILCVTRDISERRTADREREALRQQFYQAQKMEAIGRLAGGIAHDFNNLLAVIAGNASFLTEDLDEETAEHRFAAKILDASERGKGLVQQILAFSRRNDTSSKAIVDLATVSRKAIDLLRGAMPSSVEISFRSGAEDTPVEADPGRLDQVLMNLCVNASDAMEGRGSLRITVDTAVGTVLPVPKFAGGQTRIFGNLPKGPIAMLSVRDDGCGMDGALMARIFDPFFTSKADGKGTGLGLSTVHGIVTGHGGALRVTSAPGQGTLFDVILPLSEGAPGDAGTERRAAIKGGGRVLVVDDEAEILDVYKHALSRLGYEVTVFADPRAGLDAFSAAPEDYDVAMLDLTMPGMSGLELSKALRAARSDLPILICTGNIDGMSPEDLERSGLQGIVQKPVDHASLGRILANTLRGGATS